MNKKKALTKVVEWLPHLAHDELMIVSRLVGNHLKSREYSSTTFGSLDQDVQDFFTAFCHVLNIGHDTMVMATRLRTIGKRRIANAHQQMVSVFAVGNEHNVRWVKLKRTTHIILYRQYMAGANDLARRRQGQPQELEDISGRLMGIINQVDELGVGNVVRALHDIRGDLKNMLMPVVSTKQLMDTVEDYRGVWNHIFPGMESAGLMGLVAQQVELNGETNADPERN